ncbi:multidrug resistance efflux pump [Desulfosporosinus acidiphilus SJ4]|uniref:Multidrug resistance efflux pump n=1 Tax=Desulfosporosinus acidiphilus (strain DSM 22704 / JCM 16185 / SJ4) TaxID=646529 RepID=I4D8L6_DESAJ|nr:HlyD family efflux transporter periplasmic adaptor subunit [Desulfosporosinus acidiphilus]AFM42140.1 multidrug resistance efflux pump [Desulfosporosinus acidiphilus SJ4]
MSNGRAVNTSRIILINILVLVLIIGGGITVYYYYNQSYYYVSTDNARIDGQLITISALGNGKIADWSGAVNTRFNAGQRLGGMQMLGATQTSGITDITMPVNGTLVQQNVIANSFVAAGTPLAYAYDMDNLWVSANINETNINNIQQNQAVDVYVDAYPGTTLSGKVSQIGLTTAAQFSLIPQQNTTANFTKVTQVIPVVITLDGYKGLNLAPGMSVTARIHIR